MVKERCALFMHLWLHDHDFRSWATAHGGAWLATQEIETHHIFFGSSRIKCAANEIRLAQITHRWFHKNKAAGAIACLWKKKQAGELDWDVLDECRDKRRKGCARGWVEVQQVSGVYERMQRELLG